MGTRDFRKAEWQKKSCRARSKINRFENRLKMRDNGTYRDHLVQRSDMGDSEIGLKFRIWIAERPSLYTYIIFNPGHTLTMF